MPGGGMGTGSTLALLLPSAWRAEACDHDPDDKVALAHLLGHELVHVYHGQHRGDPELLVADEAGWFVEGLAVSLVNRVRTLESALAARATDAHGT